MTKTRWPVLLVALASLALPAPAAAEPLLEQFQALRAKDARVARLGHALVTGNAEFCDKKAPATGLLLHDLAAYAQGPALRRALGVEGDIAVQAVVPGSPAQAAGLAPDMVVTAIAGRETAGFAADSKEPWQRLVAIREALERSLSQSGQASLRLADGSEVALAGEPACASRFEVGPIRKRAVADGSRVVIGDAFPGHDWPDELLAGVLAHELAHNVLGHRAVLDERGRKRKLVRATEREADRLAPWLLANAGFPPEAAQRFMETWGPEHSGGIFRKRTHEGWDERAEHIAAEIPLVKAQLEATGRADWRRHFRREALPESPAG